ncbi:unnamed protein product [Rotaria sp. Silwood2]|nr:unnamed protein product [Rotaria sp. Silwood2]CAF4126342.1 unnamed protein product [Rotaria sp. Silwood2]
MQYPNFFRVILTSFDELIQMRRNPDFRVKDLLAFVYVYPDCSYLENLPRSLTEERLREIISKAIGKSSLSSSLLYIQINRKTGNACILATGLGAVWSAQSFIMIDGKTFSRKTSLTCRVRIYPVSTSALQRTILDCSELAGKVLHNQLQGTNLILELSDKTKFDELITRGAIRISEQRCFHVEAHHASFLGNSNEIDENSWYETDMLQNPADIMPFVADPKHVIFDYEWNSQIWLQQFQRLAKEDIHSNSRYVQDRWGSSNDQIRHKLRVTVMLNTLGVVRKQSYRVNGQEVRLNIDNSMKTIVYDHRSKLGQCGKLPITKTPYRSTRVDVVNNDCLLIYEQLVSNGCNPLLLNMANAYTPGGGYRKGDGAQEENLFRRSDYFRSLDVPLDQLLPRVSQRFHCSSSGQLNSLADSTKMYPMSEFGAIYTSGLTVFRQPETTGYAFMNKPLTSVCSLAMAAYRDPNLEGDHLSAKYAAATRKKIENIFAIAYHNKHDSLVLSALGCGAFRNPPYHIARLFVSVIDQYAGFFKTIVFAILDDHNTGNHLNPDGNYQPFKDILDAMVAIPLAPMNITNTMFGPYRLMSNDLSVSDVCIFDKTPCKYGGKCSNAHNKKHAQEYSHPPLCPHAAINKKCEFMKDPVHLSSFVHLSQCQYGGKCRAIDDEEHSRQYEHPSYCPNGGDCSNMKDEHLKQYRHLPLCPQGQNCLKYQKHAMPHCKEFRHCALECPHGNHCANVHDKNHQETFKHPFPTPCLMTPFHCDMYFELMMATDRKSLLQEIHTHCLHYAHVCPFGRQCTDRMPLHQEKSIHIARRLCPNGEKCHQLRDENHLNTFTHQNIDDIRRVCKYEDECHDRHKLDHIIKYRHPVEKEFSGILLFCNLNKKTNFVDNQKRMIDAISSYVTRNNWKPLPSGKVPREIITWLRTVQPVHRCNPIIFESILLHGHVMSREYMENLKYPKFVANSILQHSRIRRIQELQEKFTAKQAKDFITALVIQYFESHGFNPSATATPVIAPGGLVVPKPTVDHGAYYSNELSMLEAYFSKILQGKDLKAIKEKTEQIAEASMKLNANPSGIGYDQDKCLGTDKTVFSILGPHLGHYYGDIFIVFKREILHHPDANFTIQAATSFTTGSAFITRPWLGTDPGSIPERVKLYRGSKFNASIPGYDYAAALELIAVTSLGLKKETMDIDFDQVFERWFQADSHLTLEGHLPQLIPLDYIDHVYIPNNLYNTLSHASQRAINANFKHRITVIDHDGETNQPHGPRGPKPSSKSRQLYQESVVKDLHKRCIERMKNPPPRPIRGTAITLASVDFTDHYVLPITISQAYDQYCLSKKHRPPHNSFIIYWQSIGGDMMLTLSNEPIESREKQKYLRCLTCYIAPKPSVSQGSYHEHYSYLDHHTPFQHHIRRERGQFDAKSNHFYLGCNTDDLMTFALEVQRMDGTVTLSHAGPNAIYNQEKISHTFDKYELDLTKLNFVHVSSSAQIVTIRNLMICFEKQVDLHPTFDKHFEKESSASGKHDNHARHEASAIQNVDDFHKEKGLAKYWHKAKDIVLGDKRSTLIPCQDNVNCLLQHSSKHQEEHNSKYSHPCRFSELCKDKEPHFTHEPHRVLMCKHDKKCTQLDDAFHRAAYRHTDLPDFLVPCRDQRTCHDTSKTHRIKFSHGEDVYPKTSIAKQESHTDSPAARQGKKDGRASCQWGSKCRDITNAQHRAEYSHETDGPSHEGPCKYGATCYDNSSYHRARFSHHSKQ